MLGYLKNYPPPAVRALRHLAIATALCLGAILGGAILAAVSLSCSGGWLLWIPVAILLFLGLFILLFLLVPGTIDWAFRTRIVPVLDEVPAGGPGPYGKSPLARAFIGSGTLGRALARNYGPLVAAAARLGIPSLEELGRAGDLALGTPYLEPLQAADPFRRLLRDLREGPPAGAWEPAELVQEIEKVLAVLDEASRAGRKVGFTVLHRPW